MNGTPAALAAQMKPAQKKLMTADAWLRLALLVAPMMLVLEAAFPHPVWCALGCAAVLSAWLCADFGPFRAADSDQPAAPAPTPVAALNPIKTDRLNSLVCRSMVLFAFVFSKLTF
jgi:hypothetical protein